MARPILIRAARQMLTLRGPAVPRRGAALSELGIISDGAVLIHGTMATLLPSLLFFTGGRSSAARSLTDRGAAIALATGYNPRTNPAQNMQMTIVLACRMMEMTVEEAISAATINGAHALRRATTRGSIEPGKIADLAIFRIPDYREIATQFGVNLVETTILHGVVAFQRSKVDWSGA